MARDASAFGVDSATRDDGRAAQTRALKSRLRARCRILKRQFKDCEKEAQRGLRDGREQGGGLVCITWAAWGKGWISYGDSKNDVYGSRNEEYDTMEGRDN